MTRGCVLAAVQRDDTATAVLRAALGAAATLRLPLYVLTVVEPMPVVPSVHPATAAAAALTREHLAELHAGLSREAERLCTGVPVEFATIVGPAVQTIRETAAERNARLVVLGLGHQTTTDRVFGRETALKVSRGTSSPVLAVPAGVPDRPHRIVAAVDFGEASRSAIRAACSLGAHAAKVELLHVRPSLNLSPIDQAAWVPVYENGARRLLAELREELLEKRPDLRVTMTVRGGHPAEAALEQAASSGADLVAAGQHSHPRMERMLLGTVSTTLLRTAHCAVLIAPPAELPARVTTACQGVRERTRTPSPI